MSRVVIATLNCGSSSLKMAAYQFSRTDGALVPLLRASVSGLPDAPTLSATSDREGIAEDFLAAARGSSTDFHRPAPAVLEAIETAIRSPVDAVGHRIVQGGPDIVDTRLATPDLLAYLDTLSPLAPDHQPNNLGTVRAVAEARPSLVQTLSFDTAFHRTQPRLAQLYAIPRALSETGIIRYGYHGLSYASLARRLSGLFEGRSCRRTLALHLGSGASLCAMLEGRSIATSMGFSAMSGIPMSTRSGDVDPGAILYLITERQISPETVSLMLRKQSGLLGVSGVSGDFRAVASSKTLEASEAVELFVYRIVRECGSLIAALGGLDAVVFTGGIGENVPSVRAAIADGLAWSGLVIDPEANEAGATILSSPNDPIGVAVAPADEEAEIARGCLSVYGAMRPAGQK